MRAILTTQSLVRLWGVAVWLGLGMLLFLRMPALRSGAATLADVVIFLTWLVLSLAPVFSEVEILGVRLKRRVDDLADKVQALSANVSVSNHNHFYPADPGELERELRAEAEAEAQSEGDADVDSRAIVQQAVERFAQLRDFERAARTAIREGKSPVSYERIYEQVKLAGPNVDTFYDVILATDEIHYLVEIKRLSDGSQLNQASFRMRPLIERYRRYLAERGIAATVVPIIVVPASAVAVDQAYSAGNVLVLGFDEPSQEFVNAAHFAAALKPYQRSASR